MNHNRSPSFRRSPIQKPADGDSIKHKDKSSRHSFINHHGSSLKATDASCSRSLYDASDLRKHSIHLNGHQNGILTPNIYQPLMKYRNIGKSGLRIPSFGIAVWSNMSSKLTNEQAETILQTAYENGIYYFDTGDAFHNGKAEILLGNAIKKFEWPRSSFVVSTKLFWNHPVIDNQSQTNKNKSKLLLFSSN